MTTLPKRIIIGASVLLVTSVGGVLGLSKISAQNNPVKTKNDITETVTPDQTGDTSQTDPSTPASDASTVPASTDPSSTSTSVPLTSSTSSSSDSQTTAQTPVSTSSQQDQPQTPAAVPTPTVISASLSFQPDTNPQRWGNGTRATDAYCTYTYSDGSTTTSFAGYGVEYVGNSIAYSAVPDGACSLN